MPDDYDPQSEGMLVIGEDGHWSAKRQDGGIDHGAGWDELLAWLRKHVALNDAAIAEWRRNYDSAVG